MFLYTGSKWTIFRLRMAKNDIKGFLLSWFMITEHIALQDIELTVSQIFEFKTCIVKCFCGIAFPKKIRLRRVKFNFSLHLVYKDWYIRKFKIRAVLKKETSEQILIYRRPYQPSWHLTPIWREVNRIKSSSFRVAIINVFCFR